MTVNKLKAAIAALGESKRRRRYRRELRSAIIKFARRRMSAGVSVTAVARELGISQPTLARLLNEVRMEPETSAAGFRPVRVVAEPASRQPGLVVHGPGGLIIEGLTVEEVIQLWREMGC